jgi:hypothetical protein
MGRASDDVRDLARVARARRDCAKHLSDLVAVHGEAPRDVAAPPARAARPSGVTSVERFSGASSPAAWFDAF